MTQPTEHAVAIVGAGPIGLEVAWALKRDGIEYVHFEAGQIGATMQWWAPGTTFFSSPERIQIAGIPLVTPDQSKATREHYLAYLRQVASARQLDVMTGTRVVMAQRIGKGFVLTTRPSMAGVGGPVEAGDAQGAMNHAGERQWQVGTVVLAIGNMHRARLLDVPGEDLPFVSHYLDEPHVYFRRRVVIVGGKNSAVEAAIRLYRAGAHVTMSYRGDEFSKRVKYWLRPEIQWLIEQGRITFHARTQVECIEASTGARGCGCVVLHCAVNGSTTVVDADHVLLLTGYEQDLSLFEMFGVKVEGDDRMPVHDEATMQSNVHGVYIAGTACGGTPVSGVKVFIETSHDHAERIVASLAGRTAPKPTVSAEQLLPES